MNLRKTMLLALGVMVAIAAIAQKPKEYNLSVGDSFTMTLDIDQTIEQEMMGQTQTTVQNIINVDSYKVISVDGGNYKMKITGVKRVVNLDGPGMKIEMDSDLDGIENLGLKATVGPAYSVTMDKYGKLLEIHDFAEYKAEIKKAFVGTALESESAPILDAIDKNSVESTFQNYFQIYSVDGKKKWSTESDMIVNTFPINVVTDFERSGSNTLNASGTMSLSGDVEIQGMTMTADISGIQTSTFDLDSKTGISKTINTEQDLSGSLELQGMSIPMSIKTQGKRI